MSFYFTPHRSFMYKVSVVTPFHNVEMTVFQKAADSMRQQTIGFENVEWVIVVHNSEPQYLLQLQEMFKDDRNVIVKELNNEAKTPSSPRNYGMLFITAPYLGFLDADDSYTPNCLEETVRNMQETDSQVVCFRREFELEDEGLLVITEVVAWNQTIPRIVISRDNWDDEKMFRGVWCMVTNKLFDTRFLKEHDVTFDEELPLAEDALFCADAIAHAARVCYLPQLIGYHYFINGSSLVQDDVKSGETLIGYANGFVKLFTTLQKYGINTDDLVLGLASHLSRFMLASSQMLTLEHRQEIKRIMGPFISQASPMKPSKLVNPEEAEMAYTIPKMVIMNPEGGIDEYLRSVLNGLPKLKFILRTNKDTDYGQRYAFDLLQSIEGYQHRVPLTDYDNYAPLILLQTGIGESRILTAAKTELYVRKQSGKILPMTEEHLKPYGHAFASLLNGHHSLLLITGRPVGRATGDRAVIDTLESILLKQYMNTYYYSTNRKSTTLTPSFALLFSPTEQRDNYAIMLEAIADKDIEQIVTLTTKDIWEAFQVLEARWQEMVETISHKDPARAQELNEAFSDGMEGVAGRIWPMLKRTVAFGAGEQKTFTTKMQVYTKGIPHNHGCYFTTETMMAKAVEDGSERFKLITDTDFLEFIPVGAAPSSTPLLLSQTKVGGVYQVVVTNHAGLYRFKTNHMLTVLEKTVSEVFVTLE